MLPWLVQVLEKLASATPRILLLQVLRLDRPRGARSKVLGWDAVVPLVHKYYPHFDTSADYLNIGGSARASIAILAVCPITFTS